MALFNFTTIVVFVSFVVFMFLMKALYFDPVRQIRDERENKEESDRKAIADSLTATVTVQDEYNQALKDAHRQSTELINENRSKAVKNAADTIAAAKKEASEQLDSEMKALNEWRESAYQDLSDERTALKEIIINKITRPEAVKVTTG